MIKSFPQQVLLWRGNWRRSSARTLIVDVQTSILIKTFNLHCVKSVQIWSYFWSVFSCIRTEYGNLLSLRNGFFGDDLKATKVIPMFKKNDDLEKETDGPVSVLPHMSTVFERIMYAQVENFMEGKLSKLLTWFRKNNSAQHCLINMLEKWKYIPDKSGFVCACSWTSQIFSRRCYFFHEKPVYEKTTAIWC